VSTQPNWSRIGLHEALTGSRVAGQPARRGPLELLLARLSSVVQQGQESGVFAREVDPFLAFVVGVYFSAVYPFFKPRLGPWLAARGVAEDDRDRFVRDALVKVILSGVLARPGPRIQE
jgi:hypothetical protein